MASTLHIVRNANSNKALECIQSQAKEESVCLLLIQDGIRVKSVDEIDIFLLREDMDENGIPSDVHSIGYEEMLELLFKHDVVVVW